MIEKALAGFLIALGLALCVVEDVSFRSAREVPPFPPVPEQASPTGDPFVDGLLTAMQGGPR